MIMFTSASCDSSSSTSVNENIPSSQSTAACQTATKTASDNSSASNTKIDPLSIFKNMGSFIRPRVGRYSRMPVDVLKNAANKYNINIDFDIVEVPNNTEPTPSYVCTLKILDIFICEAKSSRKKEARSLAARQCIDKLIKPSLKIIPNDKNILCLEVLDSSNQENVSQQSGVSKTVNVPKSSSTVNNLKSNTVEVVNKQAQKHLKNPTALPAMPSCKIVTKAELPNHFIIMDYSAIRKTEGATAILSGSANFCHTDIQYFFEDLPHVPGEIKKMSCTVILNRKILSRATSTSKQTAKQEAAELALKKLKKIVHTIKIKEEHNDGIVINRNQVLDITSSADALPESNIGCKMLKMMGWKGGGIGRHGNEGISEPVSAKDAIKQGQGLGYSDKKQITKSFSSRIDSLIKEYTTSDMHNDLIFSSEFTKDERKEIHRIADKYNLRNDSKGGKGENRYLIVSRKFTPQELLHWLLEIGGSTQKYELIPPDPNS